MDGNRGRKVGREAKRARAAGGRKVGREAKRARAAERMVAKGGQRGTTTQGSSAKYLDSLKQEHIPDT